MNATSRFSFLMIVLHFANCVCLVIAPAMAQPLPVIELPAEYARAWANNQFVNLNDDSFKISPPYPGQKSQLSMDRRFIYGQYATYVVGPVSPSNPMPLYAQIPSDHVGGGVLDPKGRYLGRGHEVWTSDTREQVSEMQFPIAAFSRDSALVVGWNNEEQRLSFGSTEDFKTLTNVPLKSLIGSRGNQHGGAKVSFSVHLDEVQKRVVVYGGGLALGVDYASLKVPNESYLWSTFHSLGDIVLGKTWTATLKLAPGSKLSDESTRAFRLEGDQLTYIGNPSEVALHTIEVVRPSNDISRGERYYVQSVWPSWSLSFEHEGRLLIEPREFDQAGQKLSRHPTPEVMIVDERWLAAWLAHAVVVYDRQSGQRLWVKRFDNPVFNVVLGKQHMYVELKGVPPSKLLSVVSVSRDGEFLVKDVKDLPGTSNSDSSYPDSMRCVYRDGFVLRPKFVDPAKIVRDSDLQIFTGFAEPQLKYGRFEDRGIEYAVADQPPTLILKGPDTRSILEAKGAGRTVAAINEALVPSYCAARFDSQHLEVETAPTKYTFSGPRGSGPIVAAEMSVLSQNNPIESVPVTLQPLARLPDGTACRAVVTETAGEILFAAHGRVFVVPKSSVKTPLDPPMFIQRQQSTLVTTANGPTNLSYRIEGGQPPFAIEAACWLAGPTPDAVQINRGEVSDRVGKITYTHTDFNVVVGAFLQSQSLQGQLMNMSHLMKRVDEAFDLKDAPLAGATKLKEIYDPWFVRATGKQASGIPLMLPIRVHVTDSLGAEAFLGHYVFYELPERQIALGMKSKPAPKIPSKGR